MAVHVMGSSTALFWLAVGCSTPPPPTAPARDSGTPAHSNEAASEIEALKDRGTELLRVHECDDALVVADRLEELGRQHRSLGAQAESATIRCIALSCLEPSTKAVAACEEAKDRISKVFGPGHQRTIDSMASLGTAFLETDDLPAARKWYQQELESSRVLYGENGVEVAKAYSNLGVVDLFEDKLDAALANTRRAAAIFAMNEGVEPGFIASVHENLGSILQEMGRHAEALDEFEKALAIFRADHDEEEVQGVLENIAFSCDAGYQPACR